MAGHSRVGWPGPEWGLSGIAVFGLRGFFPNWPRHSLPPVIRIHWYDVLPATHPCHPLKHLFQADKCSMSPGDTQHIPDPAPECSVT